MMEIDLIVRILLYMAVWIGFGWLCNALFLTAFIDKTYDVEERRNYWYYMLCGPTSFLQLFIYKIVEKTVK